MMHARDKLKRIATALDLPVSALLDGRARPFDGADEMLRLFSSLPPDQRRAVLEFARALVEQRGSSPNT